MYLELNAPKITKIAIALPKNSSTYEQDMAHLPENKLKFSKQTVGVNKRYFADNTIYAGDLSLFALKSALNEEEIDAVITSSYTPDYFIPKLSNIIANELKLKTSLFCIDNIAYCNGFISAMAQAAMLLNYCKRVAIVCVSIESKKQDPSDKRTIAVTTDSASAVILEKNSDNDKMYFMEEVYLNDVMNMSTHVSAYKPGDPFLKTDNNLVFKKFIEYFPSLYKRFIVNCPESDLKILHSANIFFQNSVEKKCGLKFFNKSLGEYGCLFINDVVINLALAERENSFGNNRRVTLIGHGTGYTINIVNIPVKDKIDSKILFI